jgi:hypothetical protein
MGVDGLKPSGSKASGGAELRPRNILLRELVGGSFGEQARARAFILVVWSLGRDLNPRPTAYEAAALPR